MMSQTHKIPLADRMRPKMLGDFVGQEKLLGEGKILKKAIEIDNIPSMILWGPPGSGKTTLASIIAKITKGEFVKLSATTSGVKDLRSEIKKAEELKIKNIKTILFIDEIHRFNKSQQDTLLPFVENGTIILIGATTENPSFEV
ncbi:MAG: AAA family ATPase, partial [Candidatus Andersenbacteria bacterium]|nr:AAA family ATPase [Candidatus Andersenbacteria bacterium]